MPKQLFTLISEVETIPDPFTLKPIVHFRGQTSLDITPDDILATALCLINDLITLGEMIKHHPVECGECHEQIYAKLRSLTVEQLRELVWHSDEAQEVLTEKIKSGMHEYKQKWDDAMSVVKVG